MMRRLLTIGSSANSALDDTQRSACGIVDRAGCGYWRMRRSPSDRLGRLGPSRDVGPISFQP